MNLKKEEQETTISMDATNRDLWLVYSSDPVMIARLDKIAKTVKSDSWGNFYRLKGRQVLLRLVPKKRVLSESHKAKLLNGLSKARNLQS